MWLLDKISNLLTSGHKDGIKYILNVLKKNSDITTNREIEVEAKRLLSTTSNGNQVFNPKFVVLESKINSNDHNSNMEGCFIDLSGLYKQTELLGNLQTRQKDTIVDEFSKARAAILKLINDARIFALRNSRPEFDDIKLINFNSSRNANNVSPSAIVDPDSRLLKLPTLLKRRAHLTNRGSRTTNITVQYVGGVQGYLGKQFPPDKAIDARAETFWADLIYGSVPIRNVYQRWGPDQDGNLSNDVQGPIAVIRLSFSGAEAINQVRILPFADFPIKVLEVTYRPTVSSRIRYPINNFSIEESLDWIEFNFETVFTTDIEITLAQENYRHLTIDVPKSVLYATDFLLRLQDTRADKLAELPNINDIAIGGNYSIYNEALKDLASLMSIKEINKSPLTEIDLVGKTVLSMGEVLTSFNPDLKTLIEEVSTYTNALPKNIAQEIEKINRYEYIVGARELECNYNVYSPIGYYASERLEPASTIANVELEVDERHPVFTSQFGPFTRTSTEWEIEFAEDRKIPIFPANQEADGYLKVIGELLTIDPGTLFGLSRFKAFVSYVLVRENDKILTTNIDYTVTWNTDFDSKLQVRINENIFDRNKIYTIDYFADPSSKSIDVISLFNDKALPVPDTFTVTGPNNDIKLSTFPYINFNIINSSDFDYSDAYNAYKYMAPTGAYTTGRVMIQPTWIKEDGSTLTGISGSTVITALTGLGTNFDNLNAIYFSDPYRYYLKINNIPGSILGLSGVLNSGSLRLSSVPILYTGLIGNSIPSNYFSGNFTGLPPSGYIEVPYSIEVVRKVGDQIFGFENILYEPIDINIGGIKAKNITSYQSLEQPAFNVADANDGEYEFIHDGRTIYFNQPIDSSEIQADYRWITKYVKVNCTLRANKIISPTVTPQINEYRLLLNTTIL